MQGGCFVSIFLECAKTQHDVTSDVPLLSNIIISDEKLLKVIQALNVNKAHGWDGISVQIIKVYDSSLLLPLK